MDGRKRLSGAEYKQLRKEKSDKLEDVISKTRKLDLFFKSNGASTSASGSEENQGSSAAVTSHNSDVINLEGMSFLGFRVSAFRNACFGYFSTGSKRKYK